MSYYNQLQEKHATVCKANEKNSFGMNIESSSFPLLGSET